MPDPYRSARTAAVGSRIKNGVGYRIACASAGWVRLVMDDGSFYDVYAVVGTGGEDGISVTGIANTPKTPAADAVVTVF